MSRIALVHDNFAQMGGAEKVAEALHKLLPEADLHSTLAVREKLSEELRRTEIKTTWMQRLPGLSRYYRHYFPLYPLAVESMDLSAYDLIVSSCFGYAKGVKKNADAVHVCYCHTPARWIWRYDDYSAREQFGLLKRAVLPPMLAGMKLWDLRAAQRPDYFIANSHVVARRIRDFYRRDAVVIHPPIEVNRFQPSAEQQDYYLVLSRLTAYKRIDLAIEACNKLRRKLVVVGTGSDQKRLQSLAGPTVTFLGRQPDKVVEGLVSRCRALLFTGEEDFGMVPLEVNAAGRPVIAFRGGGATETVIEGETGVFFDQPTAASLAGAIQEFENYSWNRTTLRKHAEKFDSMVFAQNFLEFLSSVRPGLLPEKASGSLSTAAFPGLLARAS
ncbi:MAG TPA: glycosyltransferase [Blastocatellia bacterium]|nr:glycosyltransferase [Blastocatellia bacterium]HMV87068.1 glycosyltransferase [Blastocatellia bacterium]HMX24506.1 glycosyltransferase [Blastocatellia bacterium]HMY75492.1 glycosyltransferase [Blastocatellia bacterium]HMZ17336.1 glycosyltransferase [Blastocatellia bacterium]